MNTKLLTKHCALMLVALLTTAWSSAAWADVTVNVKAPSAPHMYVWNSSQTPLNGQWPGDVVTDTKVVNGETYYTKTISNESTVSVIFAKDNSTQTGDFSGLTGEVFFHYDGETLAYGDLPDDAIYEPSGDFLYFVNSKNWSTVNCHVFNGNSTSTEVMTYIGNDKAGQKVYKWGPKSNLGFVPTNVIFNNGSWASQGGVETPSHSYSNGGYYVYRETNNGSNKRLDLVAVIDASRIKNTSTYFNDTHFREGITRSLGVAEGAAFTPADYTILDLSYDSETMTGKISDLSGIEHFTNLEELDISNNSIPYGDITALTKLKKIIAIGNPQLQGFGVNAPNSSNPVLRINSSIPLEYVDVSNCDVYYLTALNTNCGSTLETLIASNNPRFDYSTFSNCTVLKHLDFSNCGLTSTALNSSHINCPNLEYLDCSGNRNLVSSGVYLTNMTKLKYFDMSGCDATPATTVANLANAKNSLEYLDLSDNNMSANGNDPALDGFTALQTFKFNTQANWAKSLSINNCSALTHVDVNGNVKMTGLTIDNCPSLQEVIITNSTSLPLISITNSSLTTLPTISGLSTATALTKIDLTGNAFTTVPNVNSSTVTTLVLNSNQLTDFNSPEGSSVKYVYAQNNPSLGTGDYTLNSTNLVGLDLGNNGFTKFIMTDNETLKSLALAGNTNLTEIELHENKALTQTSPDGVIESENGLFIKGLSSLKVLNIENSSFNKLGQQHSLQGVTALETLKARHNELTTFTNGVYELHTSATNPVNYRKPDPTQSSLEYQTNLKYLDLAYNKLRDSVHLYRNTALVHLDVSYNRSIDGQLDPAAEPLPKNDAQKAAILEQKGRRWLKYGKVKFNGVKKTYGVNVTESQWTDHYTNLQAGRLRPFDLRKSEAVCDLNDTTGLYHLDLGKNVNLEWLDISYTNIHNTAAGPSYMCPGWMTEDWVGDDDLSATNASGKNTTGRWYSSWHTFVYFIPCSKLKVIHADHNNMRSLGIRYFPELDTLTSSYMYGDSEIMRDFPTKWASGDLRYNMGNTALSTTIKKLHKVDWENLDDDGNPAIVLWGPNRTEASSDVYPNKLRYWDVSYSGFNEIRLYPGTVTPDLPYLEYVNVSGNPLNFQVRHYNSAGALVDNSTVSNYNSLDLTYCPNIRTVLAENCADLPVVRAHNRTKLDTLYLSNDANLKTLYVQNDPLLKTNFQGLSTLTGLETLFGYNNTHWGNDITFASNTSLKNLWISNIGASQLNLTTNKALEKLRAYDNSLRTLDLSNNTALAWLDVARNKLREIDLSGNTKLQFFNISNGSDTRTQLNGTEALNHDGSDGDGDKPTTVFSENDTPIVDENTGNSLSDLALPASIIDARANGNDLHCIKPVQGGSFTNLANIEFVHNHINGIDLSAAPNATVESRDNGRAIVADFATFKVKDNNNQIQEYKVYFFQLENPDEPNGTILTDKESKDLKLASRHLGDDGLALNKISGWDSENSGMLKSGTTVTPDNMGDILDPDQIPGKIVVLVPEDVNESTNEASGHATYTYTTGAGSKGSEFYLNWTSNGTVTGINQIDVNGDGVSVENSRGNLVVAGVDGTVVGVYDLNGRQVASETISGGSVTIEGLTPGIYVVNGQKVLLK